ncbi:MAG: cupredoxin domain-containing protein [Tepidiformaceae bacterium]
MKRQLVAIAVVAAVTLAACGGSDPAAPTPTPQGIATASPLATGASASPTVGSGATPIPATASPTPPAATGTAAVDTPTAPPAATATATRPAAAPTVAVATVAPTPTSAPPAPSVSSVTVSAENLAFDRAVIRVKAGTTLTATLVNKDAGVEHNLAFSLPGVGHPTCVGPCTVSHTFTAASAGSFSFFCTIHSTMFGDFIVE